ncbi:MAG: hypothetical protein IIC84_05560 [Chloroflexi bacterium]|nr:hypothetical protein [Chloroflexota bacterium]
MSSRYVGCPNCRVQYPVERLHTPSLTGKGEGHDQPADGKQYTISCAVCGHQFDVLFRKRWLFGLKAIVRG